MAVWPPTGAHTLIGGFSSALEPGNPFSVLSFPEELTRHSFLERERGGEGTGEVVRREAGVRGQLWTGAWAPPPALCPLPGLRSGRDGKRPSHPTSLGLGFLIYKMDVVMAPSSWGEHLEQCLAHRQDPVRPTIS